MENELPSIDWQSLILFFMGVAMSALGWAFKRHVDRIDHLERETVKKNEMAEIRRRIDKNAEDTNRRLDAILLHLANEKSK